MQKYCHHCHRPTDHPDHAGIQTGVNKCTLSHFDGCHEGHYNDKSWTDCPAATGGEGDGSFGSGKSKESKVSPNKLGDEFEKLNLDGAAKVDPKEFLIVDTDDEEDMHLQEEVELLRLQVQQQSQESLARLQSDEQEKKERKRLRREKLERERLELLSVAKKFQDRRPEYNPATIQPSRQNLKDKAAELAARQQWDGARQRQHVTGLTMGGIRELPGMTPAVEDWITKLQSSVPSLAKTPTGQAPTGGSFQPQGVLSQAPTASVPRTHAHVSSETIDTEFVYSTVRGKLVPVLHESPVNKARSNPPHPPQQPDDEVGEASEDEDCPVQPAQGHRLAWYRDESGRKYFLHKKIEEEIPSKVRTYERDAATGRWYEKTVPQTKTPRAQKVSNPRKTPDSSFVDHRNASHSPQPQVTRGLRTPAASAQPKDDERHSSFLPGKPDKQGRDSNMPDIVQWARNCPVSWTSKVTTDKLNAVLWAWAFISEILATRTGQAPNLQQGELEARLQHFCNVLEVTLQISNQNDFSGEAWSIGRLYDQKVRHKVENNQFTWVQVAAMNHGASLPHELMAAHQELPRTQKPTKAPNGQREETKKAKNKCMTWNKSEVRGKCLYEVENPSEKCKFAHECSYCKSKSLKPVDHQRFFCKKRLEEEG